MTERLPTELWVMAGVREAVAKGAVATVVRRGDGRRGAVILKLNLLGPGFRVLTQSRDADGRLGWLRALDGAVVGEADADAYIERQARYDEDLWVVEIEHRDGWHPYDGPMLEG